MAADSLVCHTFLKYLVFEMRERNEPSQVVLIISYEIRYREGSPRNDEIIWEHSDICITMNFADLI